MSADIRPGDLVMVVRPSSCTCEPPQTLGRTFTVASMALFRTRCANCKRPLGDRLVARTGIVLASGMREAYEISRLAKIAPSAEGESVAMPEELFA